MAKLLSKIHLFIIIYTAYGVYDAYTGHEQRLQELNNEIPSLQRKIKKTKKDKKQLDEYYKEEEKAKAKIEKVAREIEKLQKQFPARIDDNLNLQALTDLSKKLNLRDVFVQPLAEKDQGFYFVKEYQVRGTGTFLQFLIFFEKIEILSSERLLNIGNLRITKTSGKQKGRFQLVDAEFNVQAYRYNSAYREDRGIDQIENEAGKKNTKPKRKKKKGRKT